MRIHRFGTLSSTNDEARDGRYGHGDLVTAEFQTAGRGQRGHAWSSAEGRNIMCSLLLEPSFLPVAEQFRLSQAVALAVCDLLAEYGIDTRIKWTNDIYAGDRKIAGILIEHSLSGERLARTVAGVGLNVNETDFAADLPNPVSMRLAAGRAFDRTEVLERLHAAFMRRYGQLEGGGAAAIEADYRARLYRLDAPQRFRIPVSGEEFTGRIRGVRPTGELRVELPDGRVEEYLFRQIEFVIEKTRRCVAEIEK